MKKFKIFSIASTTIFCYLLWLVFTLSFTTQNLLIGGVVSLLIAILSAGFLISEKPLYLFKPKRIIILLNFIFRIMPREVWRSNLKLVKQVFSADIDVKTGIFRVPTMLRSEYGLALLANSISSRPGSVVVDITEENNKFYLYIHCINVKGARGKDAGDEIKSSIEKQVRRIFK